MDEENWSAQLLADFDTLVKHGWFNAVYSPNAGTYRDHWTIMFYNGIMMQKAEGVTFPEALRVAAQKITLTSPQP